MSNLKTLSALALTAVLAFSTASVSLASTMKGSTKPASAPTGTSETKKHHRKHRYTNTAAKSKKRVPKAKSLSTESY